MGEGEALSALATVGAVVFVGGGLLAMGLGFTKRIFRTVRSVVDASGGEKSELTIMALSRDALIQSQHVVVAVRGRRPVGSSRHWPT